MGKYGKTAELAMQLLSRSRTLKPRDAWRAAVVQIFPDSESSQEKSCPRDTFLALCEMDLVAFVPAGEYTKSVKNKSYAVRAIALLRNNPSLLKDEKRLWQSVIDGADTVSNSQMDVVITIWRQWLLRHES